MAGKSEFPVTLYKGDRARVAHSPAERVKAEFEGFTAEKKVAAKVAAESTTTARS